MSAQTNRDEVERAESMLRCQREARLKGGCKLPHFMRFRRLGFVALATIFVTASFLHAQSVEEISRENAAERLRGRGKANRKALALDALKGRDVSSEEARKHAALILRDIILTGDSYGAVHALTYARLTEDHELVAAIRQRLNKADNSWGEQHVKLGAIHALVVLENEKFPEKIKIFLESRDESLRTRAYMLTRDSKDLRLISVVREKVVLENDPSIKAVGLSALAVLEGKQGSSMTELRKMANTDINIASRARIEVAQVDEQSTEQTRLSHEEEEKLKQMAVSDRHDERMYAIEVIAKRGSEGARGWLRRMGGSEEWRVRLTSAYFLLQAGESEEAQRRIVHETQPLVQITLLATLRTKALQ